MTGFLPVAAFAELAGMSRQAAHRIAARTASDPAYLYRGARLIIRKTKGRGGNGGLSYEIAIESLPASLQGIERLPESTFKGPLRFDPKAKGRRDNLTYHLAPLLAFPAGSRERGKAVRDFCSKDHLGENNRPRRYTVRHVNRLLKEMENGSAAFGLPKQRKDKDQARVHISREVDRAFETADRTEADLVQAAKELRDEVNGNIANGTTHKKVKRYAEAKLHQIAEAHSVPIPPRGFKVSDHFIDRQKEEFQRVADLRNDAVAHFNSAPKIRRTIEGLSPNDIWFGDVSPSDILSRRDDGSEAVCRIIAWMDVATHRIFASIVLCEPNTGIRRAHVVESFIRYAVELGVPKSLYIDNGSEYKGMDDLSDLLKLSNEGCRIDVRDRYIGKGRNLGRTIHSGAYNAPAKGQIEGGFRILHRFFTDLPGYLGGDRMVKKSANRGVKPEPFPGNLDKLQEVLSHNVRLHNALPKEGQLKARSPDEVFAEFVAKDWAKTAVDENTLRLAFTEERELTVSKCCIQFNGKFWTCPELRTYYRSKVTALVPKYEEWNVIPLRDGDGKLFAFATEDTPFPFLGEEGAKASKQRQSEYRHGVRHLSRSVPKIDPMEKLAENVHYLPAPVEAPVGNRIEGTPEAEAIMARVSVSKRDRRAEEIEKKERAAADRMALLQRYQKLTGHS